MAAIDLHIGETRTALEVMEVRNQRLHLRQSCLREGELRGIEVQVEADHRAVPHLDGGEAAQPPSSDPVSLGSVVVAS